jgi:hypothetical protein
MLTWILVSLVLFIACFACSEWDCKLQVECCRTNHICFSKKSWIALRNHMSVTSFILTGINYLEQLMKFPYLSFQRTYLPWYYFSMMVQLHNLRDHITSNTFGKRILLEWMLCCSRPICCSLMRFPHAGTWRGGNHCFLPLLHMRGELDPGDKAAMVLVNKVRPLSIWFGRHSSQMWLLCSSSWCCTLKAGGVQ